MKKLSFLMAIIVSLSMIFTACDNQTKPDGGMEIDLENAEAINKLTIYYEGCISPYFPNFAQFTYEAYTGTVSYDPETKALEGSGLVIQLLQVVSYEENYFPVAKKYSPFEIENDQVAEIFDGGAVGELEYENFNAAGAKVEFHGLNIHPGSAKDKMINASLIAMEINSLLPADEIPSKTEGYEGFFHLTDMEGCVEHATVKYIIRDHSAESFAKRCELARQIEKKINAAYGEGTVVLTLKEQYRNMEEKIRPCFHIVETAKQATLEAGLKPIIKPIRGGTDGAQLSFKGLPCPNIFAGGLNFHGRYEFVPIQSMEKAMNVVVKIAELTAR